MVLEEKFKELLKKLQEAIVSYDEETCAQLCNDVLTQGIDPQVAITDARRHKDLNLRVCEQHLCA